MLIAIHSFGSIWSSRREIGRTAHYNTTGVLVGSTFRHRSCVYGYVRLNSSLGFSPETSTRMVNRVFECDPPHELNGKRKLFLRGLAQGSAAPDLYLIALDSGSVGEIDRRRPWICDQGIVLSFSDGNGKQQVLVLLPAYGWFETATGTRYVLPGNGRSSEAVLVQR